VMIAMALACEPKLLIADEPTTALDVTIQRQILELLAGLKERHRMSMLFISHDLGVVGEIADHVVVMRNGIVREQGAVADIFAAPQDSYTKALLACRPSLDQRSPRLLVVDDHIAGRSGAGTTKKKDPGARVMIDATDITKSFWIRSGVFGRKEFKAVRGATFKLRAGHTLGVVGESGSGKTTLGLAILRLVSSDGPIVFFGSTIAGLTFRKMRPFRHHMQIVFQDPYGSLSPRMSISDIIEEGLWVHHPKLSQAEREQRVIRALRDVGLDPDTRFRYPHEFSGGQRQRIAVARAIVLEPTFVVLDEPTSALDMLIQAQIVDLLRALQKRRNLTYMFISHDLRVVAALACRLLVMRYGKVVEEGPAAEVFANPKSPYTRALLAAAFKLETAPEGVVAQ
jgi:microcin C transport system ATP-binding protein